MRCSNRIRVAMSLQSLPTRRLFRYEANRFSDTSRDPSAAQARASRRGLVVQSSLQSTSNPVPISAVKLTTYLHEEQQMCANVQ